MALTEPRRAQLKAYCHIDEDPDNLLDVMYAGAVDYMAEAGVAEPAEGSARRAQYDLCINALVLTDWDARGAQLLGSSLIDNPAFQRRKNQLKLTESAVSDLDTGSE